MTDARTTGAVERAMSFADHMTQEAMRVGLAGTVEWDRVAGGADIFGVQDALRALVAERDAAVQRAEAAEKDLAWMAERRNKWQDCATRRHNSLTAARLAEAAAWNAGLDAGWIAARNVICSRDWTDCDGDVFCDEIRDAIRALRRAAPTEGEAQSLDDTTRAVLDRAERIVAGQSQQEQRTAEIFLRPTEGEA